MGIKYQFPVVGGRDVFSTDDFLEKFSVQDTSKIPKIQIISFIKKFIPKYR
jgi:hypothetical protein